MITEYTVPTAASNPSSITSGPDGNLWFTEKNKIGVVNSGGPTTATTDKVISTVTVIDGNNQIAAVGTELHNTLVALIKNSKGQPIAGQLVNFNVVSGGGSVSAGAATSDANGYVRERWTLGTTAGVNRLEISAVDSSGKAVVFTAFDAVASAGPPQSISISSGNGQSGTRLQPLASPITIVVSDSYGNPVPNILITFLADNGGSASPESVTTDALGTATTTWTLGQLVGNQTLSAAVAGLNLATINATAQVPVSAATQITKVSGDFQNVNQHSLLSQPLVVKVTDVLGNPVSNTLVTFSSSTGSFYLNPLSVLKVNSTGTFMLI
ncbi:MAG: Ig-like domain-containing protein, partial [Geobacteraceae bacterium]|nr:Ig-like domain-containing protein [Geobacteraceae bacterium]